MRDKVLLIEDDEQISKLLEEGVRSLGFDLDCVFDGESGLAQALSGDYVLILLDVNLPRLGGQEVCRRFKLEKPGTPVIMLTARGAEIDRVLGLELGADDYVTKPFSVPELMARIKARLRNRQAEARSDAGNVLDFGELKIDLDARRVSLSGREIDLTLLEYNVLALLAGHANRSFSRDELMQQVWGTYTAEQEHTATITITRLRRKLGESSSNPKYIKTVWGYGYRFADPRVPETEES